MRNTFFTIGHKSFEAKERATDVTVGADEAKTVAYSSTSQLLFGYVGL